MELTIELDYRRVHIPKRYWYRDIELPIRVCEWLDKSDEIIFDAASPSFGSGLILVGVEATAQASQILKNLLTQLSPSDLRFVYWDDFLESAKDFDDFSLGDYLAPTVLVLDHVPTTRTEFGERMLVRLVKSRFDDGRPTVITSGSQSPTAVKQSFQFSFNFEPSCMRIVTTLDVEG